MKVYLAVVRFSLIHLFHVCSLPIAAVERASPPCEWRDLARQVHHAISLVFNSWTKSSLSHLADVMRENSARENQWLFGCSRPFVFQASHTTKRMCAHSQISPGSVENEIYINWRKLHSPIHHQSRRAIQRTSESLFSLRQQHHHHRHRITTHISHISTLPVNFFFPRSVSLPFRTFKNLTLKYGEGQWIWLSRRRRRRYVWPGRALRNKN